ncbi:M1 family metallopeptidase [Oleiagrimonas sp. C23AA]|uniref:M1 family metallopeptidase n=1 Tax=Oleiagrimonas sp. C23AA TaxID=2719047 RepID=UPI001421F2AB|nr:M1 family metallopeptidase [Oleiagrimonas sp. C23AA]NII09282.1 M1 family metallopeptidase [Oleiagrimonas sp. C23AA]
MNRPSRHALAAAALMLGAGTAAHAADHSVYNPLQTFAPYRFQHAVNRYRSADGLPGPDYWQNKVDYQIKARLDPASKTLTASETIHYANHSPDTLHMLWLQLDQNRYTKTARGNFSADRMPGPDQHTSGYQFAKVTVEVDGKQVPVHYVISDTRMRIDLPKALAPKSGKAVVHIQYHYTVPGKFGGRTQWMASKNGNVFDIAQWYPRLCVYDDLRGWDTLPYLNNEFYLEYGNFDYSVTVPADMVVAGSGQLLNPKDVLTATERQRLAKAADSDKTVMIIKPGEVGSADSRPSGRKELTWHFRMQHTRDVSFAASRAFVWDAARINLPKGKHALAQSVYPVESIDRDGWSRSTEYLKDSVEHFSKRWYPYPYTNAIAVGGPVGGMEYPGIVFDYYKGHGKDFFGLTAHEIGHTWFPMIVGFDERRNAWMDEGFNTFIDVYESDDFNHGEFAPKRDGEYAPGGGNPVQEILKTIDDPQAPPILTRADAIKEKYRHPVTYFKSALGLVLLREQILGPKRFDPAFRQFIAAWAFKHPSPSDFFRAMDSAAGEDLSWFWHSWYQHNWKLDLAVTGVTPSKGGWSHGAEVTVANLDRMVMPATLEVTYADGSHQRLRLPVETWLQHTSFDVHVDGSKAVVSATVDPDQVIPDNDRANNTYKVK